MKKLHKLALIALVMVTLVSVPNLVMVPVAQAAGGMDSLPCRLASISYWTNPALNAACALAIAWDEWFHPW